LKLQHAIDVGSQFLVDVVDATVNVLQLLSHLLEVRNSSRRAQGSSKTARASFTSWAPQSGDTFFAGVTLRP
jgi:hypothetical protein